MKSKGFMIALSACMLMLLATAETQEIRGIVTDPSGAVVVGATVRLSSGHRQMASITTDSRGQYVFHSAGCVGCQITCAAPGFATTRHDLILQGGQTVLPIQLRIATSSEHIDVNAALQLFRDQLEVGEVRESAAKDVGEALTQVDGVHKIRKGGIANDVVVRGMQQGNINILIDGAHIFPACPGHMDPSAQHVDFAEVDRVDIIKGAFDVTRAGSLGATVNVITKTPPLGFRMTPSISVGSFGFVNPSITSSLGKDSFRVLGGYSYRTSQPYKDGRGHSILTYANYSQSGLAQKAFDISSGWFETEFSLNPNQKLTLGYTRQDAGLVLYPYLTMDADSDTADRLTLKYDIRNLPAGVRAIKMQTYFTQVKHFMSNAQRSSAKAGRWTMASDASTRAIGGQLTAELEHNLTFGVESYYRNWNVLGYMSMMGMIGAPNPSVPDVGSNFVGVFADYQHAFTDHFRLSGGVRFDHDSSATNTANLNTNAYYNYHGTRSTSATDNYASGNLRLSYALPKSVELFAGLGTTGRPPDAEERYINRASMISVNVGNPNLPIVRNTEGTVGLVFRHGSSYVKPTLFYSSLNDYILVNNQPRLMMAMSPASARSYTNVDSRIYGGELSYAFGLPADFSLSGGGSYAKGTNERKPDAGVQSSNLPEMPPLKTWMALRYVHKYLFAEVGGTGVAAQRLVNQDLKETPTAGYALMNMKLGLTYRKLSAMLTVDNLLNHFYYEHLSYYRDPFSSGAKVPEPGRNLFVQIKCSF
jgi:iron complex outermembrane recepter protein